MNFTFKVKIFSVHRKKEKRELRDEKEEISRTLYKCPYCEKTYTNVTRYEVHLRTHVSLLFINRPVKNLFPVHTVLRNSTRKEI